MKGKLTFTHCFQLFFPPKFHFLTFLFLQPLFVHTEKLPLGTKVIQDSRGLKGKDEHMQWTGGKGAGVKERIDFPVKEAIQWWTKSAPGVLGGVWGGVPAGSSRLRVKYGSQWT